MKRLLLAIDGPAGSGKSTVAKELARRLELPHVDTGSIYRALSIKALEKKVPPDDAAELATLAETTKFKLSNGDVFIDGENVTSQIRTAAVTAVTSRISAHPEVRQHLIQVQRSLITPSGAVVEGRDIGTVVAPDADLKVFLTAKPAERARRRTEELRNDGVEADFEQILTELSSRDERDSMRAVSPLAPASDAIVIDSTDLSADEVVDKILDLIESK